MTEFQTTLGITVGVLIWAALVIGAYIKLGVYRHRRLMRCPEAGGIALVDLERANAAGGASRGLSQRAVKNCQLWPERNDCSRGCLSRSGQTQESYGFDLASLRPFPTRGVDH
jgi:hypothetical protein